jgi:arylsulfatase A-like enzyme
VLADIFAAGFGRYAEFGNSMQAKVDETVAAAIDWLRGNPNRPFFLFVHTYQTHDPYWAPPAYASMFTTPPGDGPPEQARKLAQYDRSIRHTDTVLGGLFDDLGQLGLADHTLVVVTSDHGEAFGEHGYDGHGKTMHDELLRVPLVFRAPGLVATGRRVPGMVGLIDVVPTILDLVSIEPPPALHGVSLKPFLRPGSAPDRVPPRMLFAENELDHPRVAARTDRWKILFDGPTVEVFDLAADPGERSPLPPGTEAPVPDEVHRTFDGECQRVREAIAQGAPSASTLPPSLPDPERERRLRALGYLQ